MIASEFWSWFATQAPRFRSIGAEPDEALLDEIQHALHAYCDSLWFEVGGAPEGSIEFVVSAEGKEQFFPMVERLVAAAPKIPGWEVVAFKQPHGFGFVTRYGSQDLDPAKCWFLPLISQREPGRIALRVAVPGYEEANAGEIENGLYIVVETGLGELVSGQRVAFIEACAPPPDPEREGYIQLIELGEYIAWMSRRVDV